MWLQITSLKRPTPTSSLFIRCRVIFCFHHESELCVAAAWFLISALRVENRGGEGCDRVLVVHILNQTVQTDDGKMVSYMLPSISLIFIVLSDPCRHLHVLLSAGCHSFSWFICNLWNVEGQRWQRIGMWCILYELALFLLALVNRCLWVMWVVCLLVWLGACVRVFFVAFFLLFWGAASP